MRAYVCRPLALPRSKKIYPYFSGATGLAPTHKGGVSLKNSWSCSGIALYMRISVSPHPIHTLCTPPL